MIETLVVVGIVLAAGVYVGRRAIRTLRGAEPGCASCGGPCPAATAVASDMQRAVRRAGCPPPGS